MSSFVDHAEIEVKAGKGGAGSVSFRREKFIPKGGPDGGDGGKGGSIYLQAVPNCRTLLDYKYKRIFQAQNGGYGRGQNKSGSKGKDLIIPVPIGTLVIDKNTDEQIADLTEANQAVIIAEGGRGGKGNAHFASATHQTPKFAQPGEIGEAKELILELKLLADIGLVGFPNAGKSTLISVISSAKPKIANYPFTTLIPHLGVVRLGMDRGFIVADIPGIIEGSHRGKGLGDQFLRHIERSAILLLIIDCSPMSDINVSLAPQTLINELNSYQSGMAERIRGIVGTKADLSGAEENISCLSKISKQMGLSFLAISSVQNKGVRELLQFMEKEYLLMQESQK